MNMSRLFENQHKYAMNQNYQERQMDDMNCIIEGSDRFGALWLGNMQAATDAQLLKNNKIGAILSVCPTTLVNRNVQHLIIPAIDQEDYDLSIDFDKCLKFIQTNRELNRIGVLVHCQAGISRSATIIIVYLINFLVIGAKEALDMVEKKRWQIFPNNGFLEQLVLYERQFFTKFQQDTVQDKLLQKKQSMIIINENSSYSKQSKLNINDFKNLTFSHCDQSSKNSKINKNYNHLSNTNQSTDITNLDSQILLRSQLLAKQGLNQYLNKCEQIRCNKFLFLFKHIILQTKKINSSERFHERNQREPYQF